MEDRYLFKAKFDDSDRWVKGQLVEANNTYFIIPNHASKILAGWFSASNVVEVKKDTICQCTGLKDRNGKLIWEGDIILFQRDNDDCPFTNKDTNKRLGKVFYKGFRTTFGIGMGKNGRGSINDDLWKYVQNGNRVEVIGNIFDNQELLESEEN